MSEAYLRDRVVVVSGGSGGIGGATIDALMAAGAQVVSIDVRPAAGRPGVSHHTADITRPESIAEVFRTVSDQLGPLGGLVNMAGIQRIAAVEEARFEDWTSVIDTNLNGAYYCSALALPYLRRTAGAIVNIASVAAVVGLAGRGAYSAAKAGLVGLTRVLAVEAAPHGIRVNAVAPGSTRTDMVEQAFQANLLREEELLRGVPMGRLARPAEIASVVLFLLGPQSSYITGQCLVVDGGWSIQGSTAASAPVPATTADPRAVAPS